MLGLMFFGGFLGFATNKNILSTVSQVQHEMKTHSRLTSPPIPCILISLFQVWI